MIREIPGNLQGEQTSLTLQEAEVTVLKQINRDHPIRHTFGHLTIRGQRLDRGGLGNLFSSWQYLMEYFFENDYIIVGQDRKLYLTSEGARRAGIHSSDLDNPPYLSLIK